MSADQIVMENSKQPFVYLTIPDVFSLTENTEDTMSFFMEFVRKIQERKMEHIFILIRKM